mgnify:CR=1 FL=1
MSVLSILMKGGWLMWPIFLCSLILIVVVIERLIFYRRYNLEDAKRVLKEVKAELATGRVDRAVDVTKIFVSPFATTVAEALQAYSYGPYAVEKQFESLAQREVQNLEKGLSVVSTIVGVAPMIGFLGTVTGMIAAFMRVEQLGGNVNASVLAGGIWEALVTTAAGLGVGIVAYILYNWLVSKVERIAGFFNQMANETLAILPGGEKKDAG